MLGLSCVTGVRSFYCLFPRRRGYISPSPSPSLSVSTSTALVFHKLLSLILVFFTVCSFVAVSSSPLLVYSPFPRALSSPAAAVAIRLLSAHYILHTYVAQDAWWAFSCFLWSVAGNPIWCQEDTDPGEHMISKEQRVCQVFRIQAASIHEKFIKIWLLLKDRSSVIFNWNIRFAQNEVLHLPGCISCQIFFFFSVIPAELLLLLFSGRIPHWLKRVPHHHLQALSQLFSPSAHGSPRNGLSSQLAFFTQNTGTSADLKMHSWFFPAGLGELDTQLLLSFGKSLVPVETAASLPIPPAHYFTSPADIWALTSRCGFLMHSKTTLLFFLRLRDH